jgi:hypothetical protein
MKLKAMMLKFLRVFTVFMLCELWKVTLCSIPQLKLLHPRLWDSKCTMDIITWAVTVHWYSCSVCHWVRRKNIAVVDMCVRPFCIGLVCCSSVQHGLLNIDWLYNHICCVYRNLNLPVAAWNNTLIITGRKYYKLLHMNCISSSTHWHLLMTPGHPLKYG